MRGKEKIEGAASPVSSSATSKELPQGLRTLASLATLPSIEALEGVGEQVTKCRT